MHAHVDIMANQQGNGQNGYRNHHRDDDDRRDRDLDYRGTESRGTDARSTDYRGMGQSGYGSGFDRSDEGRLRYPQGYGYRDGDRPSFEHGMHDYEGNYSRAPFGTTREMPKESHRGKGPKNFQISDDRVRERVCEALHEDHDVDASDVEVSVSRGEVTLVGTVEDRQSKRMAEDCVLQCAGVRDVHNQLRVRR